MPKAIDVTNQKFGRLTGVERRGSKNKDTLWLFDCECGNQKIIRLDDVRSGRTKSCGCFNSENTGNRFRKHGLRQTHEYNVWCWMKARCYSPNTTGYVNYGGRGVYVCDKWMDNFAAFYADMGPRPSSKHSIDRIDNDGPYSLENCRWATRTDQNNNTRRNIKYSYDGCHLTISEWANKLGVDRTTIYWRLRHGWTMEKALSTYR